MNRLPIRSILAWLLAALLPLQGLALVVQNVSAPSHFHPSALAQGADHHHGHDGPHAPHTHALDDDDVVYVVGEHDPAGPAGLKLPPLDGVSRAVLVAPAVAPREAAPPVASSTGPLRSRSVEPLRRPPRRA